MDSSILPPQDDGVMNCSICTPRWLHFMQYCSPPWSCFMGDCLIGGSGFHFHTASPTSTSTACGGRRRQDLHHAPHHQREHQMVVSHCNKLTGSKLPPNQVRLRNSLMLPAMMLTMVMFMVGCARRWTRFTTQSKYTKSHATTNTSHRHGAGVQLCRR